MGRKRVMHGNQLIQDHGIGGSGTGFTYNNSYVILIKIMCITNTSIKEV